MPVLLKIILLFAMTGLLAWLMLKLLGLVLAASNRRRLRLRYSYSLSNLPAVLMPCKEQILALAKPCVHLRSIPVDDDDMDDPLDTKIGGMPFLASPEDWPLTAAGARMVFVAQINFAQVATALEKQGQAMPTELPRSGILQCFQTPWDCGDRELWRMCWIEDIGAPALLERPETLPGSPDRRALVPRLGWSLPYPDDEIDKPWCVLGDARKEEAYWQLLASLHEPESNHHLLGYVDWVQGDARTQTGVDGEPLYQDGQSWCLLWQICEDRAVDLGDAGVFCGLIRREDLVAGNLHRISAFSEQA